MPLSETEIAAAAERLRAAEASGVQCGLLSVAHPGMVLADAYAVQARVVAAKIAAGRHAIGWKIGLTSRAMQQALGIDVPDSGVLLDDMVFADGATVPPGRFIAPRIEAEIAFLMGAPLAGADVTREAVLAATEAVCPALEILDTRILRRDPASGAARTVVDTVADNAANAGVVLGRQRHGPGRDLRRVGAIVSRDGTVEETGLGAGVLNDPALAVAWLARRLAGLGERIEAGQIVLSGSFIRPIECPPGARIEADFGAFGMVSVAFG